MGVCDVTGGVFDGLALDWDTRRREVRADRVAEVIRARVRAGSGCSAIEYGCGTGLVGLRLAGAFGRLRLWDASPGMCARAAEKARALGLSHVEVACVDLAGPQDAAAAAAGEPADAVFSSMALHHIRDTGRVLRALRTLLTPGGALLLVDLAPVAPAFHAAEPGFDGHHGFDPAALADQLRETGYKTVTHETFFEGQKDTEQGSVPYRLFWMRAENP